MTSWLKEPALEGGAFPPYDLIGVGFGYAGLHRDGVPVWEEGTGEEYMIGALAEELALADPDHDWRIVLEGPLSGRTYQRHAPSEWVLISKNEGFA